MFVRFLYGYYFLFGTLSALADGCAGCLGLMFLFFVGLAGDQRPEAGGFAFTGLFSAGVLTPLGERGRAAVEPASDPTSPSLASWSGLSPSLRC